MKNRKVLIIIFIIIDVLVLGFVGYSLLFGNLGKEKSNKEKYTLNVYKNENQYCYDKSDSCNELGFTINTETNNAEILNFNDDFMLYNDNGLKLYNINTKEKIKTNLKDEYEHNNYTIVSNKDNALGIIYKEIDSDFCGYYNLLKKEKMYENKYNKIYANDLLNEKRLYGYIQEDNHIKTLSILNLDNEKEILSCDSINDFMTESYNGKSLIIGYLAGYDTTIGCISTLDKKLELGTFNTFNYAIYNGILYVNDNNVIKKFDFDGNLLESKELKNVEQILRNYALYEDNNTLKLYNIDTKEEIKVLDMKDNYYNINFNDDSIYGIAPTNYYKDVISPDGFTSSNLTEEGIYIVIGFKEKDSKGNSGLIYYFDETNKTFKTYNIDKK